MITIVQYALDYNSTEWGITCVKVMMVNLSLYSTATQNFRVGALCWSKPPTPEFRIGDTNMFVPKNVDICVIPDAKPNIHVTPNTKPQRQSVEYRLRRVPYAKVSRWACTFHIVCVNFICVGHPTRTSFPEEYGLKSMES